MATEPKKEGLRRRGFILGMLSAATTPTTLLNSVPVGELITSAGAQASAATVEAAATTTESLLRQYFGMSALRLNLSRAYLAAQMVMHSMDSQLVLGSSPAAIAALDKIKKIPAPNELVNELMSRRAAPLNPSSSGYALRAKHQMIEQQLISMNPKATELAESFKELQRKNPDIYKLYFGDAPIDDATKRFSQALSQGNEGMSQLKADMQKYEHAMLDEYVQQKLKLAAESTFADMAAARKAGGYPIPATYPKDERVKIAIGKHQSALGENKWIERISEPAPENSLKR